MLTPLEAFRVGFLLKCAEQGLDPARVRDRVETAVTLLHKRAGLMDTASSGIANLGNLGMVGAVAAPLGVGALGGYLAHKSVEDDVDEEDVKKQELIAELKHWARRAHEQRKNKLLLQPR